MTVWEQERRDTPTPLLAGLAALKEGLGALPLSALERTDTIEDFKREDGQARSLTAINRTLGTYMGGQVKAAEMRDVRAPTEGGRIVSRDPRSSVVPVACER